MKETDLENKLKLAEQAFKEGEIRGQVIVSFLCKIYIYIKQQGQTFPKIQDTVAAREHQDSVIRSVFCNSICYITADLQAWGSERLAADKSSGFRTQRKL
jgi:hypothetical protein